MNQRSRIVSQIATTELDQEASRYTDPLNIIPSFYIPKSGDPNKIRFSRPVFPQQNASDDESVSSPPQVPGPILSRTRTPSIPRSYELRGTVHAADPPLPPLPRAVPATNRYLPKKANKKPVNANVLHALSSSSRKSSMRLRTTNHHNDSDTATVYTSSSVDVPDPIGALGVRNNKLAVDPPRFKAGFYKQSVDT